MAVWFASIAVLGVRGILMAPEVLEAVNPWYAVDFFIRDGIQAFLILGSVVLVVTGAEALYADMGHFGRRPIRRDLVRGGAALPAAQLLRPGGAAAGRPRRPGPIPFFSLAPSWALYPMVGIATAAAIVASQALISGAFSLTRQAVQLGYIPRVTIVHTSSTQIGQIYIPEVNWALWLGCLFLVVGVSELEQPRRGVRHRRDRHDADHDAPLPHRRCATGGNGPAGGRGRSPRCSWSWTSPSSAPT